MRIAFRNLFAAGTTLALCLIVANVSAQRFSLTCSASDTLRQGEAVILTYAFENVSAAGFRLPDIEGLQLVGGPSRVSQMSIVNGVRSSAETLSYRFVADRVGTINIPMVVLDAAEGPLRTESIRFYVTADPNYVSRPEATQPNQGTASPPPPKRRPTVKM